MAATYRNKIGDLSYSVSGNIATNNNEIVTLAGSDNMIQNGGDVVRYILKEGEAIGSYYGLETDGLYTQEEIDAGHYYKYGRKPNAGDIKYVPSVKMWNGEMTLPMMTALLLAKMYPIYLWYKYQFAMEEF